jgi:hypothetical protein
MKKALECRLTFAAMLVMAVVGPSGPSFATTHYYGGYRCNPSPYPGYADDTDAAIEGWLMNESASLNLHAYCDIDIRSTESVDIIAGVSARVRNDNSGENLRVWVGSRDPMDDTDYDVCTGTSQGYTGATGATVNPSVSCLNNAEHFGYVFVDLPDGGGGAGVSWINGYSVTW